ncbi:Histone acetyltransferase HAC1 [Acorus calamus]|uniref:histone acetyltransferase n=1 Tax=Acorus calamus TaxID=4465 RepID=A0AAV9CK91_ACOCL|nr:Histone acetyltransferase HAC1 [Acorus calamus]
MSGQISGQMPNEPGRQLSGISQQNVNSIPSQIQNLGLLRNSCIMDSNMDKRRLMRNRLAQLFKNHWKQGIDYQQKLPELVKRFEDMLYRDARTEDEYMNMNTLQERVRAAARSMRNLNQSASYVHPGSSSYIGAMIPTPGLSQTGIANSTVSSSVDNCMVITCSSGTSVPDHRNLSNLSSSSHGPAQLVSGGSFNVPDGRSNGYQQAPSSVGYNIMSSVGSPRVASQMISTPGMNNSHSLPISSEISSGVGLSSVGPAMVNQKQQPNQFIGGQHSRMSHNLGGQMVTAMKPAGLPHTPSSYGFVNGAMNGGMPLISNNMQQLRNGSLSSEGYLSGSSFANSPKALQQHLDQQQQWEMKPTSLSQQLIPGDGYGLNAADLTQSGNLYTPAISTASAMNNQNVIPASLQSRSRANSTLLVHQPNLHLTQQNILAKSQVADNPQKMNFQSSHSTREYLLQSQQSMQKVQEQQFQQPMHQPFGQFVQHEQQQKQQHQGHQHLLLKHDAVRQTPLSTGVEHGMEPYNTSEHFTPSEIQNHHQQIAAGVDHSKGIQLLSPLSGTQAPLSSQQIQQMFHPQQQTVDAQNELRGLSTGSELDVLPHDQWRSQPQNNPIMLSQPPLEQQMQEDFLQRLSGNDEAQRPCFTIEGTTRHCVEALKDVAVPKTPSGIADEGRKASREEQYLKQRRWLLFLRHARRCRAPQCLEVNCITVQQLLHHMDGCVTDQCDHPRCRSSKKLLEHHRRCPDKDCPVCRPVHDYIAQRERLRKPPDTGFENSVNSSKATAAGGANYITSETNASSFEMSKNIQCLLKRRKIDHPSHSLPPKSESSPVSVPVIGQSHAIQKLPLQMCQSTDMLISAKSEIIEVEELVMRSEQVDLVNSNEAKIDDSKDACVVKSNVMLSIPNEPDEHPKQEGILVDSADHYQLEEKPESNTLSSDTVAGIKSGKPKIKGVSLTELFTPEQVREHINGLRQWVGQSKAKAEKNQAMRHSMNENSCQLCAVEKLYFDPIPIYCTRCGARIKRNAMYYTVGTGDTRYCFCIPCHNEVRGDNIKVEGTTIPKARLEKKKNDEEAAESWVQCDKCEAWQHQICALFNGRRDDGGQAEYTCPNCYIGEIKSGERKPLPQSVVLGAKDLPKTHLSDYIEERIARRLKDEKEARAKHLGKSVDEVPGAEALVVRVVSSVDKKLEVKQRFLEIFQEENYPKEFSYKSKVILLFQKIEGVEVCLFGMYVQEFGSEARFPNQRRVYLSYLDSVKYFRPDIKTVTGEALRTFVYHEILIGYLEYCKIRGFTSCYIWACPPLKGEDYILYCHPQIQKTPKSDKLREWYLAMLRKAVKENIVVQLTNLYDHFFVTTGECKARVTAARLPYFDGDYWPGAAEDMINLFQQEEDDRKHQKKGKIKKSITKRSLKAAGQTDLYGNASKDALLMQKLGETISPMKDDFIMVHLQHACSHCALLMVSGTRWVCAQCKNFQLCDKCYAAEQKVEERDRHPINSRDKHLLSPVEINGVPSETKDDDEILESEFFDTRQAFLSLCQGNHYQYDTLRRAKYSSMMVLYHLHNPTAPAFVTLCHICHLDIETGQGWRCEICPDFDVCNTCYQKGGAANHAHKLTNHPSLAEHNAQNAEARQKRVLQLREMLNLLVHASQCHQPSCNYPNCRRVKGLFRHGTRCKTRASGGCAYCMKIWALLQLHARACKESECHVPRCKDLKEHSRRSQQQSESRRRAAVMEMVRQRAAEVAEKN